MATLLLDVAQALGMCAIVLANDFAWTWWTRTCENKKHVQAGFASVAIYLLGGAAVLAYVEKPWLLIPACLAAFVGTYCASRWIE